MEPKPKPKPAEEQTKRKKSFGVSFKKGWQTIKHTFSSSRNNKVVPFHAPSDPQLGPSGQTCLRVFNETVTQNSADCLPGSCNWEQTPLTVPADPKSGSFEPQVTEEPSDHQPEQTKGKKKKKGIRACFIKGWRAVKQSFTRSRNNKVVPFPSPSDLEPSEQPGPSGQTCLRVFEPEVFQELADFLPGSCNWEQTPLKDPDDPQQGPSGPSAPQDPVYTKSDSSGVKPPAPIEADDSQPGPSNVQQITPQDQSEPGPSNQRNGRPKQTFLKELDNNRTFSLLYEVGKKLGQGFFGSVFEGIRRSDGRKIAIKLIRKKIYDQYIEVPGHYKPLYREVALNLMLLKPQKCPNIVEMLDWFEDERLHIIIMEYPQPCKTLHDFYKDYGGRLNETLARKLMWQVLNAAKHCIDHDVQHGDLKSDNILVNTETLELKLIDFGCGEPITTKFKKYLGYFMLQEIGYSLGDILLTMVAGHLANTIHYTLGLKSPVMASLGLSKECIDLICRCLHPENVNTVDELLDHDWFKQGERDLEHTDTHRSSQDKENIETEGSSCTGDHQSGSSSLKPSALQDPAHTKSDFSGAEPPAPDFQPGSSYLQQPSLQGLSEPGPSSQTCVIKPTIYPDDLLAADWRPSQTFLSELANNRKFPLLYEVGKKLGQGCFGSVFEGIRRSDGRKVAIKLIRKKSRDHYIEIPGHYKPLYREVALNLMLLKPEKCPNIVEMLDWFEDERLHIIIMEYPQPCKTLHDFYKDYGGRLNETLARKLMWQVLNAAKHCIDHDVQHGDLKSDNILVNTETLELKLIDFGSGEPIKTKFKKYLENFVLEEIVYSLGDLLLTMVAGHLANTIHYTLGLKRPVMASLGLSKECIDLIVRCLHVEDVKTVDELLDHDWFKQRERDLEHTDTHRTKWVQVQQVIDSGVPGR